MTCNLQHMLRFGLYRPRGIRHTSGYAVPTGLVSLCAKGGIGSLLQMNEPDFAVAQGNSVPISRGGPPLTYEE